MAWSSLASNQFVSRSDLQDAVTTGVFTLKSGQTIPGTQSNRWVTRSEVETWINATVSNGTSNQFPQKSWIIASGPTTTTTTTIHVPSFVVNVYNNTTNLNINQVHGTGGYVPPFSYPILPSQSATDSSWPMDKFSGSGGMYVIKQAAPGALYHLDLYRNGVLGHQENSATVDNLGLYHFSFGFSPSGNDGDIIDIYVLPGNI